MDNLRYAASGAAACIGWYLTFRLLFQNRSDFSEALRHWFTPDLLSMIRGDYAEAFWNELKMALWLGIGFGCGYVTYHLLA
jgi:hypothetical protein